MTGDVVLKETLGKIQPYRYRGYVYDVETELYYLRSRYYNPSIDRFVNGEWYQSRRKLLHNNGWCYCSNSPIVFIDENGFDGDRYYLLRLMENATIYSDGGGILALNIKQGTFIWIDSSYSNQSYKQFRVYYISSNRQVIKGYMDCNCFDVTYNMNSYEEMFGQRLPQGHHIDSRSDPRIIRNLQIALNRYFDSTSRDDPNSYLLYQRLAIDGKYGPETERYIKKFQEDMGLEVDGKAGNDTLDALVEWIKEDNESRG